MNVFRASVFLTVMAAAVLSSSCVDSHEEYWIDARGGGRGEMSFTLPAAALRLHGGEAGVERMIDSFLEKIPGIEPTRHGVTVNGERAEVAVAFRFNSALDLADFADNPAVRELPSAVTHLTGQMDVSLRGRELSYTRRSDPGRAIPGVSLLPASRLDGRLVTIIHLPSPAKASNAARLENDGRTLVWDTPLADAVKSPQVMHFKMDVPIPWTLVLGVGVPAGLAGVVLLARRFSPRKSPCGRASPPESSAA
ncbi:MAG: hypothetical protein ACO3JG_10300 [Luteolibacter sp.]